MIRFLSFVILVAAAGTLCGQPSLKLARKTVDLGAVDPKDGPVSMPVDFTNAGDEPLVVLGVGKSCECVQVKYPKKPVLPGGKSSLTVTFNPRGQEPGDYLRALKIYANTPEKMQILTVKGTVGKK